MKVTKIFKVVEDILFIILLGILCYTIYSVHVYKTVGFFEYHFFRILSNSMEPTFEVNTCIIVKEVDEDDLKVGDIITFRADTTEIYGEYNTHRIYDIELDESTGRKRYVTKGDYFEYEDKVRVEYEDIIGKYNSKMPFSDQISWLVEKLSNNKVYFCVIIFPLILCFLSYVYQLLDILFVEKGSES
ncbi:MAG: signal peptidase I [Lachnospiraceae bacterium]|nr:signal peptidase I [Lachnospiraceae bacterium]MBQ4068396.1 signal peptidase I [Lachnospiraceae bacterium]